MPPWKTIKSPLSFLVTDGIPDHEEQLEMGMFDISRAHFMPKANRELYIELPDEAKSPGEGDVAGRLNRSMYAFKDASNNWMRDWQNLLQSEEYAVGKANLALLFNTQRNSGGAVHDDDFYVLAISGAIDHIGKVLASKCKVRESQRLGFGGHCTKTAVVLNRVVVLGEK